MKPNFMLDGLAMTTKFKHLSEVNKETVNIISNGSYPLIIHKISSSIDDDSIDLFYPW